MNLLSRQLHESGPELKRTISGQLNQMIDTEVKQIIITLTFDNLYFFNYLKNSDVTRLKDIFDK